jgi:hypothetical protein
MAIVHLAPVPDKPGYYIVTTIGPGSAPPRPHPGPGEPVDPSYGIDVDEGYRPERPIIIPPETPPSESVRTVVVIPYPKDLPPPVPTPEWKPAMILGGADKGPAQAMIGPYADASPPVPEQPVAEPKT